MAHVCHIYATKSDMNVATICAYPPSQHALPHWKCVLHCCYNLPPIHLIDQESDMHHSNAYPSICFHIYHLVACFTVHGRHTLDEKKICHLCVSISGYCDTWKIYTLEKSLL